MFSFFYDMETITHIKVMKSGAGYYIGRGYTEPDLPFEQPYSRESQEYYPSKELAQQALDSDTWTPRISW
jgi:hypothetical protein